MNRKKQWLLILGALTVTFLLTLFLMSIAKRWNGKTGEETAPESRTLPLPDVQAAEEEVPDYLYTVSLYRGHIGIFNADGSLHSEVELALARLPEPDLEKLSRGITVHSEEELNRLMEDLTG